MSKAHVHGKKTTITFVYMHTGAKHMLELAEQSQDGQLYTLVASLVFSAFTLESYLNHLGQLRHSDWDKIERKYPKLKKFTMFCEAAKLEVDLTARPYSTMVELFAFRDQMAHGKTTTEAVRTMIDAQGPRLPHINNDTEWQAFATIERARQGIEDVVALVKELHKASGYTGNPFARSGSGIYVVTRS